MQDDSWVEGDVTFDKNSYKGMSRGSSSSNRSEGGQNPDDYRKKLWSYIVKKDIPRMAKLFSQARHVISSNNKKVSQYYIHALLYTYGEREQLFISFGRNSIIYYFSYIHVHVHYL